MSGFLDDREHAAENLFAHNEELLFLAHRSGVRALGTWAAATIGLEEQASAVYAEKLVDSFVAGLGDAKILAIVQADLERAGKLDATATPAQVLAQAVARASDELAGRPPPQPLGQPATTRHHTHAIDASLSWLD